VVAGMQPRKVMSDREAIITSALMFAALHVSVLAVPHLFVMGAVAAVIRLRSGSLLPCMVMHFVHNALVLLSEARGF
jgi:membrane protease YdiL (CAAX protease family)